MTAIALSGLVVDMLVGTAGAGKTTAMNALRRAWETEHSRGSAAGLDPLAVATQVLAERQTLIEQCAATLLTRPSQIVSLGLPN